MSDNKLPNNEKRCKENMRYYLAHGKNMPEDANAVRSSVIITDELMELFSKCYEVNLRGTKAEMAEYSMSKMSEKLYILTDGKCDYASSTIRKYYKYYEEVRKEQHVEAEIVEDGSYSRYEEESSTSDITLRKTPALEYVEQLIGKLQTLSETQQNAFVFALAKMVEMVSEGSLSSNLPCVDTPQLLIGNSEEVLCNTFIGRVKSLSRLTSRAIFIAEDKLLLEFNGVQNYTPLPLKLNSNLRMLELTESQLAFLNTYHNCYKELGEETCKAGFKASQVKTYRYFKAYKDLEKLKTTYPQEYEAYKSYRVYSCTKGFVTSTGVSLNIVGGSKS